MIEVTTRWYTLAVFFYQSKAWASLRVLRIQGCWACRNVSDQSFPSDCSRVKKLILSFFFIANTILVKYCESAPSDTQTAFLPLISLKSSHAPSLFLPLHTSAHWLSNLPLSKCTCSECRKWPIHSSTEYVFSLASPFSTSSRDLSTLGSVRVILLSASDWFVECHFEDFYRNPASKSIDCQWLKSNVDA